MSYISLVLESLNSPEVRLLNELLSVFKADGHEALLDLVENIGEKRPEFSPGVCVALAHFMWMSSHEHIRINAAIGQIRQDALNLYALGFKEVCLSAFFPI